MRRVNENERKERIAKLFEKHKDKKHINNNMGTEELLWKLEGPIRKWKKENVKMYNTVCM